MTLEIRPMSHDEVEQAESIRAYAFNSPDRRDLPRAVDLVRRFFPPDWSLATFEDGEMTAFLRVIPFAMRINGRAIAFGGVGPVVSLPQHRRKGHVGILLRRALEVMRERGQPLAGLHTPHPTLYRRFGWELASERRIYRFSPKDVTLMARPDERGRTRLLAPDDWAQADRVYRLHSAQRNGPIHRGDVWWREAVFAASQPRPADVALWENGRGDPEGYLIYDQPPGGSEDEPGDLFIRELVALSRDAYLNLILFALRHDLKRAIVWRAPPDDPLHSLVDDATKVDVRVEYDLLLRICDLEQALRLRPPADPARSLDLTIEVRDTSAPWNDGVWRLEASDGASHVERTTTAPHLSLSAATLAPVFNGFLAPSAGALAGLIEVRDEGALAKADAFFATRYPPHCADGF